MPTPPTIAELSREFPTIPRHRFYSWQMGIVAGTRGYERLVRIEEPTRDAFYDFIVAAWPHWSLTVVPQRVVDEAFAHHGRVVAARNEARRLIGTCQ